MKAFKYLNSQYVESTIHAGKLRVSSSAEFRRMEVPSGRGDPLELVRAWGTEKEQERAVSEHDPVFGTFVRNSFWRQFATPEQTKATTVVLPAGAVMVFENNAYMYCMSTDYSLETKEAMFNEFGADAVVQVVSVPLLAKAISAAAPHQLGAYVICDVKYVDSLGTVRADPAWIHNPCVKSAHLAWQKETRIVWEPLDGGESPFFVEIPGANELLILVD